MMRWPAADREGTNARAEHQHTFRQDVKIAQVIKLEIPLHCVLKNSPLLARVRLKVVIILLAPGSRSLLSRSSPMTIPV